MPRSSKSGHILLVSSALLAATAVVGTSIALNAKNSGPHAPFILQEPTGQDIALALGRTGLTPQNLAVSGVTAVQAEALLTAAETHYDAVAMATLASADLAVRDASAQVEALETQIRAGQASTDGLAAARTQLTNDQAQRDTYLGQLFDAATASLGNETVEFIEQVHANASRQVPIEYRVASRTDAQWTSLRTALANLDQAARMDGIDADSACETFVAACDDEAAVINARGGLANNLAGIKTAFNDLISGG